jgi:alcohol dehydrogenase class IV
LFNRYPHIGQGEANAALSPHVLRALGYRNPAEMARLAAGLGASAEPPSEDEAPARAAEHLASTFARVGMPARLRDLDVPEDGLIAVLEDSMKNFNADPRREFLEHREELLKVLRACW